MESPKPERTLDPMARLAIALLLLLVGTICILFLNKQLNLKGDEGICLVGGSIFLVAATGWPWWFYDTVRGIAWFKLITNDQTMRRLLAVLGIGLILFGAKGLILPDESTHRPPPRLKDAGQPKVFPT